MQGPAEALLDTTDNKQATYLLELPHPRAVKLVRDSLRLEGLRIPMEIDVASLIRKDLSVPVKPCRIFGVCKSSFLLELLVMHTPAVGVLPLHLVVIEDAEGSLVYLTRPRVGGRTGVDVRIRSLLAQVFRALDRIGAKRVLL